MIFAIRIIFSTQMLIWEIFEWFCQILSHRKTEMAFWPFEENYYQKEMEWSLNSIIYKTIQKSRKSYLPLNPRRQNSLCCLSSDTVHPKIQTLGMFYWHFPIKFNNNFHIPILSIPIQRENNGWTNINHGVITTLQFKVNNFQCVFIVILYSN